MRIHNMEVILKNLEPGKVCRFNPSAKNYSQNSTKTILGILANCQA